MVKKKVGIGQRLSKPKHAPESHASNSLAFAMLTSEIVLATFAIRE